jgi:hypothetical protein
LSPTLHLIVLEAGIWILALVFEFTPIRATRLETEKVPNPINCTPFLVLMPFMMACETLFNTRSAQVFEQSFPLYLFISSMSSALFSIFTPLQI